MTHSSLATIGAYCELHSAVLSVLGCWVVAEDGGKMEWKQSHNSYIVFHSLEMEIRT